MVLLLLLIAAGGALVLIGRPDAGEPAGTSDAASYPSSSPGTAGPEAASAGEGAGAGTPIPTSRRGRTHRPGPKVVEPTPELTGGVATSDTSSHAPIGSDGDPASPAPAAPADEDAPSEAAEGRSVSFSVRGSVEGLVVGAWTSIPVTISNPNDDPITVTSLRVAVSGSPGGCRAAANFQTRASVVPFTVPAGANGYPLPAALRPQIRLRSLSTSQDACQGQTFALSFEGSAVA